MPGCTIWPPVLGATSPSFCAVAARSGVAVATVSSRCRCPRRSWFVVVVPDVQIPAKTASLYARLSAENFSDGSRIAAQAARLRSGLEPDVTLLGNAFARPLYAMVPELAALPEIMRDAGADSVAISGAGPAHYAVLTDAAQAEGVAARLRERLGGPRPGLRRQACSASGLILSSGVRRTCQSDQGNRPRHQVVDTGG